MRTMFFQGDRPDKVERKMNTTTRNSMLIGVIGAGVSAAMAFAGEPQWAIAVGIGAAATAVVNYALENKEEIADALEDAIEDATGIDIELDDIVSETLDEVKDIAEDLVDDGKLNNTTGEVDIPLSVDEAKEVVEQTQESLSKLTVKDLKAMLKDQGMTVSGTKKELVERLLK